MSIPKPKFTAEDCLKNFGTMVGIGPVGIRPLSYEDYLKSAGITQPRAAPQTNSKPQINLKPSFKNHKKPPEKYSRGRPKRVKDAIECKSSYTLEINKINQIVRKRMDKLPKYIYMTGELWTNYTRAVNDIKMSSKILLAFLNSIIWSRDKPEWKYAKDGYEDKDSVIVAPKLIAECLQMKYDTLYRALKNLERKGYISIIDYKPIEQTRWIKKSKETEEKEEIIRRRAVPKHRIASRLNNKEAIWYITILEKFVYDPKSLIPYVRMPVKGYLEVSKLVGDAAAVYYFYLRGLATWYWRKRKKKVKPDQVLVHVRLLYHLFSTVAYSNWAIEDHLKKLRRAKLIARADDPDYEALYKPVKEAHK